MRIGGQVTIRFLRSSVFVALMIAAVAFAGPAGASDMKEVSCSTIALKYNGEARETKCLYYDDVGNQTEAVDTAHHRQIRYRRADRQPYRQQVPHLSSDPVRCAAPSTGDISAIRITGRRKRNMPASISPLSTAMRAAAASLSSAPPSPATAAIREITNLMPVSVTRTWPKEFIVPSQARPR